MIRYTIKQTSIGYFFRLKFLFWDNNSFHAVIGNNTERSQVALRQFARTVTSCKLQYSIPARILSLIQSRVTTFHYQDACAALLYPAWLSPSRLLNLRQPLICPPVLAFCHFKNVVEIESYSMSPFGIVFFFFIWHNSMGIPLGVSIVHSF